MEDPLMLACGKTLGEANSKVCNIMARQKGFFEWSQTHQYKFAIAKFGIMGFSRRREPNLAKKLLTIPVHRTLMEGPCQPCTTEGLNIGHTILLAGEAIKGGVSKVFEAFLHFCGHPKDALCG